MNPLTRAAYQQGHLAFRRGDLRNPFRVPARWRAWQRGWRQAQVATTRETLRGLDAAWAARQAAPQHRSSLQSWANGLRSKILNLKC